MVFPATPPNIYERIYGSVPYARASPQAAPPPPLPTIPEEEEQGLLQKLGMKALSGLGYLGRVLDKTFGGRAVRGVLGGNFREGLSLLPFSDTLGITDESQTIYGRQLLQKAGILGPNEEGLDPGDVAGFGAEVLLDPIMYLTRPLTAAGRAAEKLGALPRGWRPKIEGFQYSGKQLGDITPVQAGVMTASEAVPAGSSIAPRALVEQLKDAGTPLTAQYRRVSSPGSLEAVPGVSYPLNPKTGAQELAFGTPARVPLSPMAGATDANFEAALKALEEGRAARAGEYLGRGTEQGYHSLDIMPPSYQGGLTTYASGKYHPLRDVANEGATPLAGLLGLQLPFGAQRLFGGSPLVLGFGDTSKAIAGGFDRFGTFLKGLAPIRYARANLSYPVDRAITPQGQLLAEAVKHPEHDRLMSEVLGQGFDFRRELEPILGRDTDEVGRYLLRAGENVPVPHSYPEFLANLRARDPNLYARLEAAGQLNDMKRLWGQAGQPGPIERLGSEVGQAMRQFRDAEQAMGIPTPALNDFVDYAMRRKVQQPWDTPRGLFSRLFSRQVETGHSSQLAREDILKGIPGGSAELNDLIRMRGLNASEPTLTGPGRALTDLEAEAYLRYVLARGAFPQGAGVGAYSALPLANPLDPAVRAALPAANLATPEIRAQARSLADWMKGLDPRYALEEGRNFFDVDLLTNYVLRGGKSARSRAGAETAYEAIRRFAGPASPLEKSVPIPEVLQKLGLTGEAAPALAGRRLGLYGDDVAEQLAKYALPENLVSDMTRWLEPLKAPSELAPVLKTFDKAQALFKGWLTRPFPAFHVRNIGTGLYNMFRDDAFSPSAMGDAQKVLRGGTDIAPLPGMRVSKPQEVRDAILREATQHGVAFTYGSRSSADLAGAAGTAEDLARLGKSIPGRVQLAPERLVEHLADVAVPAGTLPAGTASTKVVDILKRQGMNVDEAKALIQQRFGQPASQLVVPDARVGEVVGLSAREVGGDWLSGWGRGERTLGENLNPLNIPGVKEGPQASSNALMRQMSQVADASENWMRLSHYIAKRRQGYAPAEAAKAVEKYHFNYAKATPFEKAAMKRLVPFWMFSTRNLPVLLEDLATRGGKLAAPIRASTGGLSDRGEDFTPAYLQEGTAIPVGGAPEGFGRFISSLGLPYEDEFVRGLGSILGGDLARGGGQLMGGLTPFLKYPIESATGTQVHTGRKLEDLRPTGTASLLSGFNEEYARPLSQLLSATPASRAISTIDKLADTLPGGRKSIPETALNLLTGARVTDVDLARQKEIATRQVLQDYLRGKPGFERFEKLYVRPENVPQLTEQEYLLYALYRQLEKEALQASKLRKEQAGR